MWAVCHPRTRRAQEKAAAVQRSFIFHHWPSSDGAFSHFRRRLDSTGKGLKEDLERRIEGQRRQGHPSSCENSEKRSQTGAPLDSLVLAPLTSTAEFASATFPFDASTHSAGHFDISDYYRQIQDSHQTAKLAAVTSLPIIAVIGAADADQRAGGDDDSAHIDKYRRLSETRRVSIASMTTMAEVGAAVGWRGSGPGMRTWDSADWECRLRSPGRRCRRSWWQASRWSWMRR